MCSAEGELCLKKKKTFGKNPSKRKKSYIYCKISL